MSVFRYGLTFVPLRLGAQVGHAGRTCGPSCGAVVWPPLHCGVCDGTMIWNRRSRWPAKPPRMARCRSVLSCLPLTAG